MKTNYIQLSTPDKPLIEQSNEDIQKGLEKAWNELRNKTLSSGKTFLVSEEEVETADGKIIPVERLLRLVPVK